jgi:glucose-6-phosphate isomerase/transaldolase/glucose-6-phosphate isomerase
VENEVGKDTAGAHFVAITDPGTQLESLAQRAGFRHCFTNATDIGGRYSVLSFFGLVPAALLGMNLRDFLYKAGQMQERCAACADIEANPGVWPGVLLGACARNGRDKLTLVVSPSIASFGLWLEQLIAESIGKEGRGIVPIIDEPPAYPTNYGRDRVFVYLRSSKDDNAKLDGFVEQLELNGQPIIQLHMEDSSHLGAEFFRWEMITAVAGVVLGVNPFDQPDVQAAKDATKAALREGQGKSSDSSQVESVNLADFLAKAEPGRYLAILAYLKQIPSLNRAIRNLRADVMRRYKIATTAGYGPRYLHSTGQLHKGGPATGMFVEVTASPRGDLGIPGLPYSFGDLTRAAAEGDYRVLKERRRPVTRVELNTATGAAFERTLRVF